ncbi:DNA-binding IclR family transcriptional regulator [Naumannella cuiyingiana]|uniref:DNA-binding IclR family transcriptional regulator n=1 Tax=Naumannella cuiyingiana TaxID=1347891 RepID=A0A7Z0IL26_9ACTN|nr:IclR family transcriptional regulator [Naumannella cuiyingiana]NYI71136.1 DNA-binding IclR family transcriptional regulator [Naumannella cuiyingiana]
MQQRAPAAGHALGVLSLLARQPEPLPATRIAAELGLPRSSTYHLLGVLVDHGYVVHLPEERRYGLGVAAHELGSAYARQAPLQRLARPLLNRLVDRSGHNGHFAALHGGDVVYLIEERAPGRPSLVTDVGVRLPAHLTASGMALLAALGPRQIRALYPSAAAFTHRLEAGPRTPTQLRHALIDVRGAGYACERGSVTAGLSSVAVAALDHTGHPVGAFALTYPDPGTPSDEVAELIIGVRDAAARLGRRLHRG